MARWYDVTFVGPKGGRLKIRASGNTQRSAERWATYKLRTEYKRNVRNYSVESIEFAGRNLGPTWTE